MFFDVFIGEKAKYPWRKWGKQISVWYFHLRLRKNKKTLIISIKINYKSVINQRISGLPSLTQSPRFDIGEHRLHELPKVCITQGHQGVVLTILPVTQRLHYWSLHFNIAGRLHYWPLYYNTTDLLHYWSLHCNITGRLHYWPLHSNTTDVLHHYWSLQHYKYIYYNTILHYWSLHCYK